MVERAGLENRSAGFRTVGSNPTLSAIDRKLDSWFRKDVRGLVARLFNEIAEREHLIIQFDPRSALDQGLVLPPEDRLPRAFIRNPNLPGAKAAVERRDEQRRMRSEHARITAEIDALDQRIDELVAEVRGHISGMSQLSSWEQEGRRASPLDREVGMTALMGAGIDADTVVVDDIGTVYIVDDSTIVDSGDLLLFDHGGTAAAASALRFLARKHGWRDLSAQTAGGMPIPVPSVLRKSPSEFVPEQAPRDPFDFLGKQSTILAVNEILDDLRTASPGSREAILDRVSRWGSDDLNEALSQLVAVADQTQTASVLAEDVVGLVDDVVGSDGGLWRRYCLEMDLAAMCLPGSRLARPFNPVPRFYEIFDVPRPEEPRAGS